MAAEETLLQTLRGQLHLTGAKYGCGAEACGACMVVVNGAAIPACTLRSADLDGAIVVTPEGVDVRLPAAFVAEQAGQCAYCVPGILASLHVVMARGAPPDRNAILAALEPHLCRCGAQPAILRAAFRAAEV